MTHRDTTTDPVLNVLLADLEREAGDAGAVRNESRARQISALTRDIRFQFGPPWMHEPESVDHVAEALSRAAGSIRGTQECGFVRQCAVHVLQRMIYILEDKHGWTNRPWLSQREALRKQSAQ